MAKKKVVTLQPKFDRTEIMQETVDDMNNQFKLNLAIPTLE